MIVLYNTVQHFSSTLRLKAVCYAQANFGFSDCFLPPLTDSPDDTGLSASSEK